MWLKWFSAKYLGRLDMAYTPQPMNYWASEQDYLDRFFGSVPLRQTNNRTIPNINGYVAWDFVSNRPVEFDLGKVPVLGNTISTQYSEYDLVPVNIVYYRSLNDLLTNTQLNSSREGFGGYTIAAQFNVDTGELDLDRFRVHSSSTGSSSGVYSAGATLSAGGTYFVYYEPPPVVFYYGNQADASTGANERGSSASYTVQNIDGYTLWVVSSRSTGSSTGVYTVGGATLTEDGMYYLYPAVVLYYVSEFDSINNSNLSLGSLSYTVASVANYNVWKIDYKTGTSPSNALYAVGNALNSNGIYSLYPVIILYYGSEANATNDTSRIGSSTTTTVETIGGFSGWRVASTSTGSFDPATTYNDGDSLAGDGTYYLYPADPPPPTDIIFYFANETDASTTTNEIGSSATYTTETFDTVYFWIIASNSTGASLPGISYPLGEVLDGPPGTYYLYPTPILYYDNETNALAYVTPFYGNSITFTIQAKSGIGTWKIASNSTGPSGGTNIYFAGDTLTTGGIYYLYAVPIIYYSTEADALVNSNPIGNSSSFAVETVGGFSSWRIASTSTGTSDPATTYNDGDSLTGDGTYYLYPADAPPGTDVIFYYANENDAYTQVNQIGTSTTYTVETIGGFSSWTIASTSTGSSSGSPYDDGDTLNASGLYYLYPVLPPPDGLYYYPTEADALVDTNRFESTLTYTVEPQGGYTHWKIAPNSTGSSSINALYKVGDILNDPGKYYLYAMPIVYYSTEADAIANTGEIGSSTTYTTETFGGVNFWLIASNSTGSSDTEGNYPVGYTLTDPGTYYLYPTPILYYGDDASALAYVNPAGFSKTFTVQGQGAFDQFKAASNSTGTYIPNDVYIDGTVLNPDGIYYLYYYEPPPTDVLFYFPTEADASADTNRIDTSTSYTIGTVGGESSWKVSPTLSTGTFDPNATYTSGDVMTEGGLYYLYPPPPLTNGIYYYPTEADALANTNELGNTLTYTIEAQSGYTYWKISINSGGTFSPDTLYRFDEILTDPGTYFLYPMVLVYFATVSDALATMNPIGSSETYTVETIGLVSSWNIAANSTGSSPTNITYVSGDTLNSGLGYVYYLYVVDAPPPTDVIYYYPTEADALAGTGEIGSTSTYSIQAIGGFTVWLVSPRSTGSASETTTFADGDLLPNDGTYYIYPATVAYYRTEADAVANTNVVGSSTTFTIQAAGSYRVWKIEGGTGTSSKSSLYDVGDTLLSDGTYTLYPVPIVYYSTEADALANATPLGSSTTFTIETTGGFSSWRIASNSVGSSSRNRLYATGAVLNSPGGYYLYPGIPCFLEGSKVLCKIAGKETYIPIETIRPGTLVKTLRNGYRAVALIGKGQIQNTADDTRIQNRLYKCTSSAYREITEDLYLTGCHSILVDSITDEQREKTIAQLGKIFVTENKYRLMACIDERAEPWKSEGTYTIWHLALENEDIHMNYGIWVNGLRVETSSINFLRKRSNMTLM
jgi:hypothetical protein